MLHSVKYWTRIAGVAALLGLFAPAGAQAQEPAADAWIVMYDQAAVDSVDRETDARERRRGFRSRLRFRRAVEGFSARLTDAQVRALRADPDVDAVVRDLPVRALAAQPRASDEPLPPSGVRRLGLSSPSSVAAGWVREASDVSVAVLDSGVDLDHPDLNVANGVDCVAPNTTAEDENGHGTHVAGTIGAENDGYTRNGVGVSGVAPGTRIQAVRVLNASGSGTTSTLVCGIDWVLANASARNIRVINMSIGGAGQAPGQCGSQGDHAFHAAVCRARDAGILSVVAAGNEDVDIQAVPVDEDDPDGETGPGVPAVYPEVLTVTAINDHDGEPGALGTTAGCGVDDRRAPYSNFATSDADEAHMIAAPGTCITSTWLNGTHSTVNGTSMSTPHAAGVAALCIGEAGVPGPCATLTPAQMITRLRDEARAHRLANPGSGFSGDPEAPLAETPEPHYGYLIRPLLAGPQTSLTTTPPDTTDDSTPTFEFSSPTPGVTFECSVDGTEFAACSSPHTTGELADGTHSLAVRAVDVAGTRDGSPSIDSFTVDAVPDPPPTVTATPESPVEPLAPPDRTPPTVTLGVASRQNLATILRRGIRVSVLCSEACRAETSVVIPSGAALKLRLSKSAITAGRKGLGLGSGRRYVTIKLTSSVRKRLARARSVLVQVRVTARDAAGNRRTVKKAVRLAR